ncbi:MAG: DegT/DnrJ/EryC1/StrS family aminotransferase [Nitrosopumilus sp.]|nr:DegT/DnrJ/EryC1/StrS family aminotransferase [Nitrosopumilus sp.]
MRENQRIRLFEPRINQRLKNEVIKVLESNEWYSGTSKTVERFERKMKDYLNCKHVVAVNSGTAALHLSCSLFEPTTVHTTALSFVSTANTPLLAGHDIIFNDIYRDTLNIYPNYDGISLLVHFGGYPINRDSEYHTIIEDCAHAMGSRLKSKNIKCFSFHAQKNLAMPSGGAIALYDDEHVDELRAKRWCGIEQKDGKRDVKGIGWNYVMNNVSAVCGIEQLRELDNHNAKRRYIAWWYNTELTMERMPFNTDCSYHLYWIIVPNRDEFRAKMDKLGIETGFHYPSIDRFSAFKEANIPTTHYVSDHIVTLPIHPNMTQSDLDRVIKSANSSV